MAERTMRMPTLVSAVIGVILLILWAAGRMEGAEPIAALAGVGAVVALMAAIVSLRDEAVSRTLTALGAIFLFGSWMIGLRHGSETGLSWLTFVFGCAMLLLAVAYRKLPDVRIRFRAPAWPLRGRFAHS
jgi:uncharacterized membrane protein